jgi:hypothetical protein
MAKIPYVGLNSPFGNRGPDRNTPMNADTRGIGSGLAEAAIGIAKIGGSVVDAMQQQREQEQALAAAEAQVELQRRTNAAGAVLTEWTDIASRPGYNLENADQDIQGALDGIEKRDIPNLSPERKIIYDGAMRNLDQDTLARAGQYRKTVYANRAEAAFAAGTDELGSRATNPDQDINELYANADAMGEAAAFNLPVDMVQTKVRAAKESISAGRIGIRLAGAQSIEALDALEADVGGDKYVLDGTKKAAYLSTIANKKNTLQNRMDNDLQARERGAERAVNDLQGYAKSGFPPQPQDVLDKIEATRGTPFEKQARQAAQMIDMNKEFYTMPLAEAEKQIDDVTYLARNNAKGNEDPAFIKSALSAAQEIVKERKALAMKHPIEAMATDSGVKFEKLDYQNPVKLAEQVIYRMDRIHAYQKRQGIPGIPPNPFTEAEQLEFNDLLTRSPNDKAKINLLSAVTGAATGPGEFKQIMAEVKQNSPLNYAVGELLAISPQAGKNTAAAIYDGQKILTDKIMPVPAENLLLSEYLTRTDGALDPSSDEFKNGYERFKRLYATKLTADMSKDVVSSDAATWAFSMATGGVAKTDYGSIVKPYGMRTDDLIKKLPDAIMSSAKAAGVALDDLDSYELDPRPDYNGQYYLIQANGEIVVNPKTSDPIIVKIK